MKNKTTKTIALLLSFLFLIFSFAACKKKVSGKTVEIENEGKKGTRVFVTDNDGEIVTDEAGNAYFYDNLGETQLIALPSYYVEGKKVVTTNFYVTIPKGWSQHLTGEMDVNFVHEKTGNTVKLVTLRKSLEKSLADMEDLANLAKENGANVEIDSKTVYGVEAAVYKISNENGFTTFWIFEKSGTSFSFYTLDSESFEEGQAGYSEVLDAVVFK